MFEGRTFLQLLMMGGGTLVVLLICSVVSLSIIIERAVYFRNNSKVKLAGFMKGISAYLEKKDYEGASILCDTMASPFARVAKSGLKAIHRDDDGISNAMERQIGLEINDFERFMSILGSIGSTVVYIGLFGTVIGIIQAFHNIALSTGGGMSIVISGIAEALVSTASGIIIAVPTVIAYNLYQKTTSRITMEMEICASEISDLLRAR